MTPPTAQELTGRDTPCPTWWYDGYYWDAEVGDDGGETCGYVCHECNGSIRDGALGGIESPTDISHEHGCTIGRAVELGRLGADLWW